MASTLAAPNRPLSSASNRSSAGSTPGLPAPTAAARHVHSLSSSTPSSARATPAVSSTYHHPNHGASSAFNTPVGGLSPSLGSGGGGNRPRQSLDAARMLGAGAISPRLGGPAGMRPTSEMLGLGGGVAGQGFGATPETEAIDRWFEDLQSYEATLEEMAAASLDANFKEELSAIEQWFRVLSEAERTAALYSLLQSSTQVQIRFFITVLQQMARSDPMSAILSPGASGNTPSMEQQMEAKLAQLGAKSPVSPVVRQFARQSLSASTAATPNNADAFLSPHHASMGADSPNGLGDPASLLANQRAKLKANNRVSAPGMLLGGGTPTSQAGSDGALRSPKWGTPSGDDSLDIGRDARASRSPSPAGRPKSTAADAIAAQMQQNQAALARAIAMTSGLGGSHLGISLPPSAGGAGGPTGFEGQLSPIVGGSWASQVNTPLVPMFGGGVGKDDEGQQGLGEAANKLAASGSWGAPGAGSSDGGIQLDDARKFRRPSKATSPSSGLPPGASPTTTSAGFSGGVLAGMQPPSGAGTRSPVPSQAGAQPQPPQSANPLAAQAAAMAAQQNWRNNLAAAAAGTGGDPSGLANNFAMMNLMNGMGGMGVNDPAAIQNMANLIQLQQQMQQAQQLQALQQQIQHQQKMGGGMMSPVGGGPARMGFPNGGGTPGAVGSGFPSPAQATHMGQQLAAFNAAAGKRSPGLGLAPSSGLPGTRSPGGILGGLSSTNKVQHHVPGSGANPDEELDMKLISDIPAWLRGLRLHKYTPNFERCRWEDMVLMDEAALEARGVAAVGARRKMLRTFETVRLKKGMALPGDGEGRSDTATEPGGGSPMLDRPAIPGE